MDTNFRKVLGVGDAGCGKKSLLHGYTDAQKLDKSSVHLKETQSFVKVKGEQSVPLSLYTVSGLEDEDSLELRQKHYRSADIILLCFALDCPRSLHNAVEKWYPEIRQVCQTAPIVLVGNKSDLKVGDPSGTASGPKAIQDGKVEAASKNIHAHAFMKCSARYFDGLEDLFQMIGLILLEQDESCSEHDGQSASSFEYVESNPTEPTLDQSSSTRSVKQDGQSVK